MKMKKLIRYKKMEKFKNLSLEILNKLKNDEIFHKNV